MFAVAWAANSRSKTLPFAPRVPTGVACALGSRWKLSQNRLGRLGLGLFSSSSKYSFDSSVGEKTAAGIECTAEVSDEGFAGSGPAGVATGLFGD